MKRILTCLMAFLMIFTCGLTARAADADVNRRLGYFDNTRSVLLLPALYRTSGGDYAAAYLDKEMRKIFRFPYYRLLRTEDYADQRVTPDRIEEIADESGADIVVLPVVSEWVQWVRRPMFFDGDAFIYTRVIVDVYTKKQGEQLRDDRAAYQEDEDESSSRNYLIMDEVMKRLYRTFPYQRVPKDVSDNLSGPVDDEKDNTPKASMNK